MRERKHVLEVVCEAKEVQARVAEEARKQEERRRRKTGSWWSGTFMRRGGLPGRGHRGDSYSCHHRTLPEVRRRRRG